MLNTGDILTESDLLALDSQLSTDFGTDWSSISSAKRRLAVEGFLTVRLEQAGLPVSKHINRRVADALIINPATDNLDITSLLSARSGRVPCNSIWASDNELFIQSAHPFRGVFVGMVEGGNTNTLAINSLSYWNGGAWSPFTGLTDATRIPASTGPSLAGGGRITWQMPDDFEPRQAIDGTGDWFYTVRMQIAAVPNAGTVFQIAPIVRSRLTIPAAYHALSLMYMDAVASQRGPWEPKAEKYGAIADSELAIALPGVRDEFDVDATGAVAANEVNSVAPAVDPGGFEWSRG